MRPEYLLRGKTELELQNAAVDYLLANGYTVGLLSEWETKETFCRRVGISEKTFSRRMKSRHVPPVKMERGSKGKIIQLRSNTEFDSYMKKRR